jgi:hypothetical protein
MKRALTIGLLALALAGPGLAGAALAQPPMPYGPIPPPRYEPPPPPPGDRYIWEPGHWHWNGVQYVWFRGRYVIREMRYHNWVDGRWVWSPQANHWVWRPAHWE